MEFIKETKTDGLEGALFKDKDGKEIFLETTSGEKMPRNYNKKIEDNIKKILYNAYGPIREFYGGRLR